MFSRYIFSLTIAFSLAFSSMLSSVSASQDVSLIRVNGSGVVKVDPDAAQFTVGVETRADTASKAQSINKIAVARLISALKESGVQEDDIKTQWFTIYPQYDWSTEGKQKLLHYQAQHTLQVTVHTLDKVHVLIEKATEHGANNVSDIQYILKNKTKAYDEARKLAAENAKSKASTLASLFSVGLGSVHSVEEMSSDHFEAPMLRSSMMDAASNQGQFKPGKIELSINLMVQFEIVK